MKLYFLRFIYLMSFMLITSIYARASSEKEGVFSSVGATSKHEISINDLPFTIIGKNIIPLIDDKGITSLALVNKHTHKAVQQEINIIKIKVRNLGLDSLSKAELRLSNLFGLPFNPILLTEASFTENKNSDQLSQEALVSKEGLERILAELVKHSTKEVNTPNINYFPKTSLERISNITEIDIGDSFAGIVPIAIRQMDSIRRISICNGNAYASLQHICLMRSVEHLGLYGNLLKVIPDSVAMLKKVKILDLSKNLLESLPVACKNMELIEQLSLDGNRFVVIPQCVFHMKKLAWFDISSNQLDSVSEFVGELKNLEFIDLSSNRLTDLPKRFGRLTNLAELNVGGNLFKELPSCVGRLTKLTELDLHDNEGLDTLPHFFKSLKRLKKISLRGNAKYITHNFSLKDMGLEIYRSGEEIEGIRATESRNISETPKKNKYNMRPKAPAANNPPAEKKIFQPSPKTAPKGVAKASMRQLTSKANSSPKAAKVGPTPKKGPKTIPKKRDGEK